MGGGIEGGYMSDMVIFEADTRQVEVRLEGETLWITQSQMAELFATSADNISLHLKNIYKDNELDETATAEDFSVVRQEGVRRSRASSNTTTWTPSSRSATG
jgi:hypothetical protein